MKKSTLIIWLSVFTVWFVLVVVDLFVDIFVKNVVIEGYDAIRTKVLGIALPILFIWSYVGSYRRKSWSWPIVTKPLLIRIWAVFGTLLAFLIVLFIRDVFIDHTLAWEYSRSLVSRFLDMMLPLIILVGFTVRYVLCKKWNVSDSDA
ncbi:MAG: hypothetical protein II502_01820, partial [Paludibacteraceae bacterium]|nr:hypothetical protein [Paludibacteraceae bacterium]